MSKKRNISKKITSNRMSIFVFCTIFIIFMLFVIFIYNVVNGRRNDVVMGGGTPPGVSSEDDSITVARKATELEKIKSMTERGRIEYYATKFLNYIESGDYSEAYSLLNKTYKKNYFSDSEEEFEKYCTEKFPKMMSLKFSNIERNGEIYVIWVTVTDAINGTRDSGEEINFVIKENNFNDFELSFSKF